MGIYHYPPPPPVIGGAQPYAPLRLPPAIIAVEVDTPPFTDGGPVPLPASVVAVAQPNPWTYCYLGAAQPFGPKTLSPRIPGQSVDLPPSYHPGRSTQTAALIALAQPDPWTFSFLGTSQPFGAKTLSPAIPGQDRDAPPFSHWGSTARTAALIALWQPDPWTYSLFGTSQPFAAKSLSPGIPGQDLDLPQPNYAGRFAQIAASLIALAQPDPWTFSFFGASQPFGGKTLSPAIPGQDRDAPPFSHTGSTARTAALIAQAQPDPWTYSFFGTSQPFGPKTMSPGIPGQDLDLPAPNHSSRMASTAALIAQWQPDPWTFSFFGASQPFGAARLSAGIPGQDIDRPPSTYKGPFALPSELVGIAQPDPWAYSFQGARQPYAGFTWVAPVVSGMWPPASGVPNVIAASLVSMAQPDRWTFSFFGAAQPFGVKTLSPGIPGEDIDRPPPYSDGGPIALKMQLVAQQQPDPWTYTFFGGAGPFLPRAVDAAIPGTSITQPPTNHPSRGQAMAAIRSAWDPPPPDYLVSLYARLPVPQGITIGALPGTFTIAGINALLSIVELAGCGQFSEIGIPAMLTRDFVNWLPATPITGQWTPDNVMVIPAPVSE